MLSFSVGHKFCLVNVDVSGNKIVQLSANTAVNFFEKILKRRDLWEPYLF